MDQLYNDALVLVMKIKIENCTTRNISVKITENQFIAPKAVVYYLNLFNIDICWDSTYQLPLQSTIDTKRVSV